ncbi:hypothetical protein C8R44DRAFT_730584 [Mycena epipterygia]|nr:hypothetical protein C8R44DRAFT_730584 [Mycena epipterygia]
MDVNTPSPPTPGACQPGTTRSLNYYWPDGSMWISPVEEPATAVKRKPTPVEVVQEKAQTSGGNGSSESAPLWIQPNPGQFEIFLECVFLELGHGNQTRSIEFWQTALEMADFFDAEKVKNVAIVGLDKHNEFDPFLRLDLAIQYKIHHWVEPAFRTILLTPLESLSESQIDLLGFTAYIILATCHSKTTKHRILCSLTTPPVVHSPSCSNYDGCRKSWEHAWWGEAKKHGVAIALIHPTRVPAKQIAKALADIATSWHMSISCRTLTVRSLTGITDRLMMEENYIKIAVKEIQDI